MFRFSALVMGFSILIMIGCQSVEDPNQEIPVTQAPVLGSLAGSDQTVLASMQAAGNYFKKHQLDAGRFEYLINPEGTSNDGNLYNVVRHAGVLYALAAYATYTGDMQFNEVLQKASDYLLETNVKPVDDTGCLAVWSVPGENFYKDSFAKAKLGATGLALTGLIMGEQVLGKQYPLDKLQKLGDFLCYMQLEDGGFYATYHEKAGRVEPKMYQFFPGEAALGLCLLYQRDKQQKWLDAAIKAVSLPANTMEETEKKAIDHWDLIAIAKVFEVLNAEGQSLTTYDYLKTYSRRLVERLLAELAASPIPGCFTDNWTTTPTATRLEGLTAAMRWLPADDALMPDLKKAIPLGCQFLMDAQLKEGPHAGGIPMAVKKKDLESGGESRFAKERFNNHAAEIRIDYVQHVMCALLGYHQLIQQGLLETK
ncbi:MAG: hypothetical protein R2828_08115 [Saprospiraceae bacterium]